MHVFSFCIWISVIFFPPIMFEIFLFCLHSYFLYVEEKLSGHEFEQALGDSEGQGSLACCSLWGCKESDVTERLNNTIPHTCVNMWYFPLSDLLHCVWQFLGPSMLLQMALFHSTLWPSNIPFCVCVCTTSLSIPPLMDIYNSSSGRRHSLSNSPKLARVACPRGVMFLVYLL